MTLRGRCENILTYCCLWVCLSVNAGEVCKLSKVLLRLKFNQTLFTMGIAFNITFIAERITEVFRLHLDRLLIQSVSTFQSVRF